jgi:phenylalanyl-tRNA synthetase beta chain
MGFSVTTGEIKNFLTRLNIDILKENKDTLSAHPPSYRLDLDREIDLIEEVGRIKGYDKIPETLPKIEMEYESETEGKCLIDDVSSIMLSEGFDEIITYSFIENSAFDKMLLKKNDPRRSALPLRNPMSEDMAVMRTTLFPGMMRAALTNMNHLNFDLRLFEIDRVFMPRKNEQLPEEEYHLMALVSGSRRPRQWRKEPESVDFFDVKGVWESIVSSLRILDVDYRDNEGTPYLEKTESCEIIGDGTHLGEIGKVRDDVMNNFDLPRDVYILEVNLTRMAQLKRDEVVFTPIPRYPPVLRDISLLVSEETKSQEILNIIMGTAKNMISDVDIFDLYTGEQIEAGKKSIALTVKYQSPERTLTDGEVNDVHDSVIEILTKQLDARIR